MILVRPKIEPDKQKLLGRCNRIRTPVTNRRARPRRTVAVEARLTRSALRVRQNNE